MKLVEISTDQQALMACASLLQAAFPDSTHHTVEYLTWLYCHNPAGPVVGYNAWEGDVIIGHYACIPVEMYLDGETRVGLLALHTAMHPNYRNAGVIYSLARKTCKLAAQRGFACIYAVANAASTPVFVKALGFQFVCQLSAALGLAGLQPDWEKALEGNRFRRRWSAASARWRAANPANPTSLQAHDSHAMIFRAHTHIPMIAAYGLMPVEPPAPANCGSTTGPIKLFLGLLPEGSCRFPTYLPIPERFKPSPLNFIYLPLLEGAPQTLARNEIILGVHDFDPY